VEQYYRDKLSAQKLLRVYELASPRVQQYLNAEIEFCLCKIREEDTVLELGCGYGRILQRFTRKATTAIGIDTSLSSLLLMRETYPNPGNALLLQADAAHVPFPDATFDVVVCAQNGISAFHVDQKLLIRESVRVTRQSGICLFTSYSDRFWQHRLEWFRAQAAEGLLGEIDELRTGDGEIVCKDGFTATTVRMEDFYRLTADLPYPVTITEIDDSSLFCEIYKESSNRDLS
jgi:2-polyprenyl-6-hydroxyphenyl methylase/3-demethylubiquinone-9 3-methyltransferase